MKTETFKISYYSMGDFMLKEVEARRITIAKHKCFIFKMPSWLGYGWNISDLETGYEITRSDYKEAAIFHLKSNIEKLPKGIEKARDELELLGIQLPVNI